MGKAGWQCHFGSSHPALFSPSFWGEAMLARLLGRLAVAWYVSCRCCGVSDDEGVRPPVAFRGGPCLVDGLHDRSWQSRRRSPVARGPPWACGRCQPDTGHLGRHLPSDCHSSRPGGIGVEIGEATDVRTRWGAVGRLGRRGPLEDIFIPSRTRRRGLSSSPKSSTRGTMESSRS